MPRLLTVAWHLPDDPGKFGKWNEAIIGEHQLRLNLRGARLFEREVYARVLQCDKKLAGPDRVAHFRSCSQPKNFRGKLQL